MKVAFITRSTLYKIHGGSAVQIMETAKELRKLGVDVTICLAHEKIDYNEFDLLHFFDLTRPANILYHIKRSNKPFVVSPLLVDYSEYDRYHRKGISGSILRSFSADTNEYIKTITRWLLGKDSLKSKSYIWKGQRRSIRNILKKAKMVLPNSEMEYQRLKERYGIEKTHFVIPNGIDTSIFGMDNTISKDETMIICAARFEGLKNQLNLIMALNNTTYKLVLIGDASPNQKKYLAKCKEIAGPNVVFTGNLPQQELADHYQKAKVHILPSWFETCGLSSLEAAAMGCNIVISNKGFAKEYFGDDAFYCDPGDINSIFTAVSMAAKEPTQTKLQAKVLEKYTWKEAAAKTCEAYKTIINRNRS